MDRLEAMGIVQQRSTRSAGAGPSGGVVLDNPDQPSFRFGKETDEYKFLVKLFKTNSVKASDRPSDFKSRYEIFRKIKSDSFRNKFNDLKKEYGVATKTGKKIVVMLSTVDPCEEDTLLTLLSKVSIAC